MADFEAGERYRIPLFDGLNFNNWKFRMETLLSELDLLVFVEKNYNQKVKYLEELQKRDKKCRSQIIADNHLEYVKDKNSAYDMWKSLRDTFLTKRNSKSVTVT